MPPNCLSLHTHFHPPTKPTSLLSTNSTKLNLGFIHFPRYSTSSFTPFKCNLNLNYQDFLSVAHNKVLIAAGVSAAIGQLSKPITGLILYGRPFDIKSIIQAGGFPSTHSSAVVATATCLALERGFSDSIFGMAAVYAALIMYDAQGVRREVGIHAKTLNKLLLECQTKPLTDVSKDIKSLPGKPSSTKLESSATVEGPGASRTEQTASTQLLDYKLQKIMNDENFTRLGTMGKESEINPRFPLLKESIGHTEVEVIAGALLGFLVSLTVNALM